MGSSSSKTEEETLEKTFQKTIWQLRDIDIRVKEISAAEITNPSFSEEFYCQFEKFQDYWIHLSENDILLLYEGGTPIKLETIISEIITCLLENNKSHSGVYSETIFDRENGYLKLKFDLCQNKTIYIFAGIIPEESQINPYKYISLKINSYSEYECIRKYKNFTIDCEGDDPSKWKSYKR